MSNNIGYIAGKIKNVEHLLSVSDLKSKNGERQIAEISYSLEIEDLDGNVFHLNTPYKNIAFSTTYLHFLYDKSTFTIEEVLKNNENNINLITGNIYKFSFNSLISIFLVFIISLGCFNFLNSIKIPFDTGFLNLLLSIVSTIPVALITITLFISLYLFIVLSSIYLKEYFKTKKYNKYKMFYNDIRNNKDIIKQNIRV